jgi:hypothetical protein
MCWPSQKGAIARLYGDFEAALAADRSSQSEPARTVGLAWRRTLLGKEDFIALGKIITQTLGVTLSKPRSAK